mmetsp:Transcript_65320/g.191650  ORF Transcript_65320/g.191650 Transcript_65320/m.191650 type:complete len:267 (+) Transcript_65320:1514-2314(+)
MGQGRGSRLAGHRQSHGDGRGGPCRRRGPLLLGYPWERGDQAHGHHVQPGHTARARYPGDHRGGLPASLGLPHLDRRRRVSRGGAAHEGRRGGLRAFEAPSGGCAREAAPGLVVSEDLLRELAAGSRHVSAAAGLPLPGSRVAVADDPPHVAEPADAGDHGGRSHAGERRHLALPDEDLPCRRHQHRLGRHAGARGLQRRHRRVSEAGADAKPPVRAAGLLASRRRRAAAAGDGVQHRWLMGRMECTQTHGARGGRRLQLHRGARR